MELGLTVEQVQLAEAERSWLTRNDPMTRLRASLDTAPVTVDPAALHHVAESGLTALLTPDLGGTHADLAVLTEAHGYAASSFPLADLAIGNWLLSRADLAEAEPACEGELLVGLARGPVADVEGDRLRLRGTTSPIPMAADMACVAVAGEYAGGEYVTVVRDAVQVKMSTLDLSRSWARLDLDVSVQNWTPLPLGTVSYLRDALAVHRALDALGAAARLLEMTVAYAGQREQFGAPIGSFQAVKHHCADMAVTVEAGRAVLAAAVQSIDADDDSRPRTAAAAAAYIKAGASRAASTALQVHGGIGFTWEHDLHVFLRRIKVDEAFDGTVAQHRAALVSR